MRIAVACIAAVVVSACSDPAGVAEQEGVRVEARSNGLDIHNGRSSRIYTIIFDREIDAVIEWIPCADPEACDGVDSGETRIVSGADIAGWGQSSEVIVYWWHLIPEASGGFRPDPLRWIVVSR